MKIFYCNRWRRVAEIAGEKTRIQNQKVYTYRTFDCDTSSLQ